MRSLLRFLVDALRWVPALLLLAVVVVTTGLLSHNPPGYVERAAVGEAWQKDGFTVAVVWPRETPEFVDGARLAWEMVDRGTGGLAGKIRLQVVNESPEPEAPSAAVDVIRDRRVLAVIGHAADRLAPASLVYEQAGVLFITPQGSNPRSTSHNFNYVFRLMPGDVQVGATLARYAAQAGLKRVGMIYARNDRGESLARQFAASAATHQVTVPFSRSYHHARGSWSAQDFRPLAAEIRKHAFDALVVADVSPMADKVIRDLVQMGVQQPILVTNPLDPEELWRIAGLAAAHVLVVSGFEPALATPEYSAFHVRYVERYGREPGLAAMQGYESFMLVARACLQSDTAAPLVLATTIRLTKHWPGLSGTFAFTASGEVTGQRIAVKHVRREGLETVYAWEGIEQ